jgi:hypothetical protein
MAWMPLCSQRHNGIHAIRALSAGLNQMVTAHPVLPSPQELCRGACSASFDGVENRMTIQRAAVHALCVLAGLAFWIAQPNAGLAECDLDVLHFPVSLKLGHVKTPEFTTRGGMNAIEITVKNVLPAAELSCMMGISEGPQDPVDCNKESLVEANWKVWSGGHVAAQGSSRDMGKRGYYQGNLYGKYIGVFKAKKHEKYSLEVDFTKDGSALAVADPHLTVSDFLPSDISDPKPDHETLYTTYLPLTPGHFRSPEFEGNKGLNIISFSVVGRLATAKEFCLFGIQARELPKCSMDSAVDFEWTVWSNGKIVAAGTSRPLERNINTTMYSGPLRHCGGVDHFDESVGFFKGSKGQKFSIEVNVKRDGSELNIAYPTLSVVKGYPPSAFAM